MTSWIIGNWKLNPVSLTEVNALIEAVTNRIDNDAQNGNSLGCHLMVAPSYLHLTSVKTAIDDNNVNIKIASQDVATLCDTTGAYTGDVSAAQLKDAGVQWAIIGHSERRQFHDENNDVLLQKLVNCAAQGIGVILCIGESEADFEAGITNQVLAKQLEVVGQFLHKLENQAASYVANNFIVAYEPVWAIGTGKVPSVEDVTRVHQFIRKQLCEFSDSLSDVPLIYGGSVKPDNAKEFAAVDGVDGVLVGGAALNADSFIDIAQCFVK